MIAGSFVFMLNRTDYRVVSRRRCDGFYSATRERMHAASQSAAVGSKLVATMTYLERGIPHTPREGHENLANAK